jgi:cyclohexane-1-carbonyl-CoA dehydrogenase
LENLLGRVGIRIAMKDFDMSRPAIAAQALGIAEELWFDHQVIREACWKPVASHPAIRLVADSAI